MSSEKKQVRSRKNNAKPQKDAATSDEKKTATSSQKATKAQRAPSAYSDHMRDWMRQYKTSGYAGSTKEYFAAGARGWKDKKTVVETIKESKKTTSAEKKETEKSTE